MTDNPVTLCTEFNANTNFLRVYLLQDHQRPEQFSVEREIWNGLPSGNP